MRFSRILVLLLSLAPLSVQAIAAEPKNCDAQMTKALAELRKAKLVMRVANDNYDVYVSRDWYALPLDTKQGSARIFLQCISKGSFVNILDGHTGKQLAKDGTGWGYRNYED